MPRSRRRKTGKRRGLNNIESSQPNPTQSSIDSIPNAIIHGFYYDAAQKKYFRLLPGANNHNALTTKSIEAAHSVQKVSATNRKRNIVKSVISYKLGLLFPVAFRRQVFYDRLNMISKPDCKKPVGMDREFNYEYLIALPKNNTSSLLGVFKDCNDGQHILFAEFTFRQDKIDRKLFVEQKLVDERYVQVCAAQLFETVTGDVGLMVAGQGESPAGNRGPWCCHTTLKQNPGSLRWTAYSLQPQEVGVSRALKFAPVQFAPVQYTLTNNESLPHTLVWYDETRVTTTYFGHITHTYYVPPADFGRITVVDCLPGERLLIGSRRKKICIVGPNASTFWTLPFVPNVISVLQAGDRFVCSGFSAETGGHIGLFDVKSQRELVSYAGYVNHYRKIPVSIDEDADVLCSGMQNGHTRLWRLSTGCLLVDVPAPVPLTSEDRVFSIFKSSWGGPHHMGALVIAAKNVLYLYNVGSV